MTHCQTSLQQIVSCINCCVATQDIPCLSHLTASQLFFFCWILTFFTVFKTILLDFYHFQIFLNLSSKYKVTKFTKTKLTEWVICQCLYIFLSACLYLFINKAVILTTTLFPYHLVELSNLPLQCLSWMTNMCLYSLSFHLFSLKRYLITCRDLTRYAWWSLQLSLSPRSLLDICQRTRFFWPWSVDSPSGV